MKSEHRKELHSHELQRWSSQAQHYLERYGTHLLVATCAVVLLVVSIWAWRQNVEQTAGAAWTAFANADSAERFAEVAETYPKSSASQWARLREAELHLKDGIQFAFSSRTTSRSSLKKAEEIFERIIADGDADPMLRQRALFGLATAQEATSDGDLQPAIETYRKILDEFGEKAVYASMAKERLEDLGTPSAKKFYAWFHEQDPKPEDRTRPRDLRSDFDLSRPRTPEGPRIPFSPSGTAPVTDTPSATGETKASEPPRPPVIDDEPSASAADDESADDESTEDGVKDDGTVSASPSAVNDVEDDDSTGATDTAPTDSSPNEKSETDEQVEPESASQSAADSLR